MYNGILVIWVMMVVVWVGAAATHLAELAFFTYKLLFLGVLFYDRP